jgi:hypothetical protein
MTADTVIIHVSDWNPRQDLQVISSIHRIEQKNVLSGYSINYQANLRISNVWKSFKKHRFGHVILIGFQNETVKTMIIDTLLENITKRDMFLFDKKMNARRFVKNH